VEEIGSRPFTAKTEPTDRIDHSADERAIVEKIYAQSSAREEITFIRTNYPSACGIETLVRLHVCDLR